MQKKQLNKGFFERPTLIVARALLGKYLVRKIGGKTIALMIIETEGYDGFDDKASHASRGQTPRNTPMFGEAGTIYVYFTYGMHWMLNIVCGKEKYPAAVLIRGVEGISGPARLTKALKINRRLNTKKLSKKTGLWIEDRPPHLSWRRCSEGTSGKLCRHERCGGRGMKIQKKNILATPRIGVGYAGEWAHKPWRFVLKKQGRTHAASAPKSK